MKKQWVKHVVKEGSREHVVWWDRNGAHCTEKDCEINRRYLDASGAGKT